MGLDSIPSGSTANRPEKQTSLYPCRANIARPSIPAENCRAAAIELGRGSRPGADVEAAPALRLLSFSPIRPGAIVNKNPSPEAADTDKRRIFLVIPAYNEGRAIRSVVAEALSRYPNVVVVNDGSTDDTASRVCELDAYLLEHYVNRGQGAALMTGIQFALRRGADVVVTFDADGQHDPADIGALVEPVLRGECDVALGSRFLGSTTGMPLVRRLLLRLAVIFTRLVSRVRVSDAHNGLRAFSRGAAGGLQIRMDGMAHGSEIFDQIRLHGWRYLEVPVTIRYTPYSLAKGQTSWNAFRIAFELLVEKLRQ